MDTNVLVSIIVPVYNVEQYLKRCLDSIYSIDSRINKEVILINDGSEDNSLIILEEYKYKYYNETILVDQNNVGLAESRNRGLCLAKGKYISFIDSDDFIDSTRFVEVLYSIVENELDFIIGNGYRYPDNKRLNCNSYDNKIFNGIDMMQEMFKNNDYSDVVWRCIYSKNFLKSNNIEFISGLLHEDMPFTFQCFLKAKKVQCIDKRFYFYCIRSNSITNNISLKNWYHRFIGLNSVIDNYLCENISYSFINMEIWKLYFYFVDCSNIRCLEIEKKLTKINCYQYKILVKRILRFINSKYRGMRLVNLSDMKL